MLKTAVFVLASLLLCAGVRANEQVSHAPPKVYAERLAALLTPAAEAMKLTDDFVDRDDAAIALLFETVRYVDAKGGSCLVLHRIERARNEQGVARLAKDEIPFRKNEETIHLVMARSVQPDGSSQDVAANAAFLQSPQRDGDASLFTDYAELVTLYPNVRPGTVRESIIVIDEPVNRIPDQYTARLSFGAYWPQARVRHVIDIDNALAARLTVTNLGSVPDPDRKTVAGATRLTWTSERIPKTRFEPARAPFEQVGPVVYLTTLKDWNAFGAWYTTLLQGRDKPEGPLADAVTLKTADRKTTDGVIEALLTEAAREVRYTGLEFGIAGFQPQDPNQVWTNRYGDCKDKANLLRAMLHAKSVPAYIALVNTQHAGRVEKRSPDYRHFNHAILAVPQKDGTYLFCDPTIKYARPGMLRPDDTDRDVLLIKENGVEFVHTPPQASGLTRYDFDLKMAANGSLSGWMAVDAHDLQGAQWLEYFAAKQQRELLRDRMLGVVQGYFRAAQLIDVETMQPEKWNGVYHARVYFMVPGSASAERSRDTVEFPFSDAILPNFGDSKVRQTTYWQDQEHREIRCRIQLPTGWSALDLPRPFQLESAPVGASARWEAEGSTITASFELTAHQSVVPAEQFPLLFNAYASLRVWLGKPLQIGLTKTGPTTVAVATQPALADFPLMSSGEGQLELVDRRFPIEAGVAARREALQKVLQWFPEEAQTRFVANMRLTEIDLKLDPKNAVALDRARALIAGATTGVDLNYVGWGEFLLAVWEADAGRKAEAAALLTRQAGDARLSAFRRGWAAVEGARVLEDADRDKAIALLTASLNLDSTTLPLQYVTLADLLLKNKQPDVLRQRLNAVVENSPQRAGGILSQLTRHGEQLRAADRSADATALGKMLDELITPRPELAHLREAVAQLNGRLGSQAALTDISASLKAYLAEHPPAWWDATVLDPAVKTREQFQAAIQKSGSQPALEPYAKYTMQYLTQVAPDAQDFAEKIVQLANSLATKDREPELLELLLASLDRLPDTDPWKYEAQLIRAFMLSQKKDEAAALSIYQAVSKNEKAARVVRSGALRRAGELHERLHQYAEALAMYKELEGDLSANRRSIDALLRAVFINLERDDRDEAARVLSVLGRLPARELNAADSAAQIHDLLELTRDAAGPSGFWKRQEAWWPLWLELEKNLDFPPAGDALTVPVVFDAMALGRELGQAARANDRPRVCAILRIVAHCARWQPRYVPDFASLFKNIAVLAPARQNDLRKIMVAALRGFESADPQIMRPARLHLAIHLIDTNDSRAALDVLRAYRGGTNPPDPIDRAMNRLWAIAAAQTRNSAESAAAIHALEADLARPEPASDRALTVKALVGMYRSAGQTIDEVKLLKAELDNPTVKADAAISEELRLRYQGLQSTDAQVQFVDGLSAWMRSSRPSWYDFAPPKDLSDYGSQDLDEFIKTPPVGLSHAEATKVGLLIAQSPIQPLARRIAAFEMAIRQIAFLQPIPEEQRKVYASVHEDARFPEGLRRLALASAAHQTAWIGGDVKPYLANPLAAGWPAYTTAWINSARKCAELSDSPADALEKELYSLLEMTVGPNELDQFWAAYRRLIQLDPAAARRVFRIGEKLKLSTGQKATVSAVRLQMLKLLTAAERYAAANRAVQAIVAARFPEAKYPAPADFRTLRTLDDLDWLDHATVLATSLERARHSRFLPDSIAFWQLLVHQAKTESPDGKFGLEVQLALLSNLPADDERAKIFGGNHPFYDSDDATQRDAAAAMFKPFTDPTIFPLTSDAIRMREIATRFRTHQPVDLANDFKGLRQASALITQRRLQLIRAVCDKDADAARAVLSGIPTETLLDPLHLRETLPALELAGMNDEAMLLREAGHRRLAAAVLQSWTSLVGTDIGLTFTLASALNAPDEVPAAWRDDLLKRLRNAELRGEVETRWADLRGDWAAALPASDAWLTERPTVYAVHWYRGRALLKLGRNAEAAAALEVFVKYCNDQVQHGEAVELLGQAKAK